MSQEAVENDGPGDEVYMIIHTSKILVFSPVWHIGILGS